MVGVSHRGVLLASADSSHSYTPGILSKCTQFFMNIFLPQKLEEKMKNKFVSNCIQVKKMEDEIQWIKRHHSPLRVLELPETVTDINDVKKKYKDLTLLHHPDQGGKRENFEEIQVAYHMLMNRKSMWYMNGYSSELSASLSRSFTQKQQVYFVGSFIWIATFIGICLLGVYAWSPAIEKFFAWYSPEFYEFMLERERIDAEDRAMGYDIDPNPVKLAPKHVHKLHLPGKYLDEL